MSPKPNASGLVTGQVLREGFRTQKVENVRNGDREFVSI